MGLNNLVSLKAFKFVIIPSAGDGVGRRFGMEGPIIFDLLKLYTFSWLRDSFDYLSLTKDACPGVAMIRSTDDQV